MNRDALQHHLDAHGQGHTLAHWDRLDEHARAHLAAQLLALDLAQLTRLHRSGDGLAKLDLATLQPVEPLTPDAPTRATARTRGEEALHKGEVAVLLVAGGQGSRLGFEQPKGMFPVGPLSGKTLFQLHAEKVLALRRHHGAAIPFLIMTSPATHTATEAFFHTHRYFGLPSDEVLFFQQGTMPALDAQSGKLLLETPGSLFLSPDGHGGALTALAKSGLLARLKEQGVQTVFYFQVDNPLVAIADPVFVGLHHLHGAEVSSKCVAKRDASERAGIFARTTNEGESGRCLIVEYSDLPAEMAAQTTPEGRLRWRAASPAIHLFAVSFLERMTAGDGQGIPFHVARKKVPHLDDPTPQSENGLKFERFIFDVLPQAERWLVVETPREEEFAPLKNAEGDDSPATVRAALLAQAARWVQAAGARAEGEVELSPLFALDEAELRRKVAAGTVVTGYRE
jgi:UDP-N-acetylglucosamine/UDP-N-acetylgalactosamine diphosphorylase